MNNILKRRWIWLKRFRKRCGYGVHSPFAFGFITWVIYEKGEYYAYEALKRKYGGMHLGHKLKCSRLLFRLSNFVHPDRIEIVGNFSDEHIDYITNGCVSAEVLKQNYDEKPCDASDNVLCFLSEMSPEKWKNWALRDMTDKSACIVEGIYKTGMHKAAWKELCDSQGVVISFDLYDYGILFYDRKKLKQNYVVNFN